MKKFSLQTRDWLKGLAVSVGTAVLMIVQQSLDADTLTFNWKAIGMAAVGAAITYLGKNFFTDDVKVAKKTLINAAMKDDSIDFED